MPAAVFVVAGILMCGFRKWLPVIQEYYEREDSKEAFAEWKAKK